MPVIQRVMVSCAVVLAAAATPALAQTGIANMVDHIHLAVPDQEKGVAWYAKHFGGQPMTEAPERLMFGETRVIFQKNEAAKPSTGNVSITSDSRWPTWTRLSVTWWLTAPSW